MRVGLTYDLREDYLAQGYSLEETAEFDRPETIAALEAVLRGLGYQPERIGNVQQLCTRLAAGERWAWVFNIAEGLHGLAREAQIPALLDAYAIPYTFSDPLTLALALHKGFTKHIVRSHGIRTPDFAVLSSVEDIAGVELPYPLFAKPVAEGTSKGITSACKITTAAQLQAVVSALLQDYRQPVLVETFLPGREFTVGVLGNGTDAYALGVMEVVLLPGAEQDLYSYDNKEHYEQRVRYRLVDGELALQVADVALAAWRCLGCRDGGRVDVRLDECERPQFLEVNPLAGLNPQRSDLAIMCGLLGLPYEQLIARIVECALQRYGLATPTMLRRTG